MKYRIVDCNTFLEGLISYVPQYKRFIFWHSFKKDRYYIYVFPVKGEAERFIQRDELRRGECVKKKEIDIEKLRDYLRMLRIVLEDDVLYWNERYEIIFHSKRKKILEDMGIKEFDWSDPDTSYEEDVRAYVNAFEWEFDGYLDVDDDTVTLKACIIADYITKIYGGGEEDE